LPGIDQDDNLRSLLESGSSSEDEKEEKKKEEADEETEAPEGEKKKKSKKKKKGDKKSAAALPDAPALMDENSPSEDAVDMKPETSTELGKVKVEAPPGSEDSNPNKRKATDAALSPSKKPKVDLPSSILQLAA